MSTKAVLVDVEAIPRIVITFLHKEPDMAYPFVDLQICGPKYQIQSDSKLNDKEKSAPVLVELLSNLNGTATYSLWGIGDYRHEGALLNCTFEGDGLGHFTVNVKMAENSFRFEDKFTTDQTCLMSFITTLQTLGE